MKILSLFDGISCARVALERAGIPVSIYYASEIDKYAIQVSNKNFPTPKVMHIGDVTKIHGGVLGEIGIDLLVGGSPCQDLSIAKKDRKGLDGERSGLFWEYVRILKEVKPKYFILENVASMSKESKDLISEIVGVQPIMIDAKLLSAQSRKRYFWTNIPNVTQPQDKGIIVDDILVRNVDTKYFMNDVQISGVEKSNYQDRKPYILGVDKKIGTIKIGGDVKRIVNYDKKWRYLTPVEYERLQGLPDNYTEGVSNTQRYKCCGNAFNVDVVAHILSFIPR